MPSKNIVILGAGFGGLRAATQIAKHLKRLGLDKYRVVLIDRNDCHLYTPLLYMIASSPNSIKEICTYDISSLIKDLPIAFVQDEVVKIDLPNGDIHIKNGSPIKADFLVVALGSETNYFGIPGLKENSLQLKTLESAMQIKMAVADAFKKGGEIKIVAGGAGANGIELAAEIRLWANRAEQKNKNLRVAVSIIEAMPTILPGLNEKVIRGATQHLEKLGVAVSLNMKIVSVTPREITLDGGKKMPFDVFIWTGGIKSPELLLSLPLQKEQRGKILAQSGMACLPATADLKLYPMVYGLGDNVCFMNPETKRPVPAVARAAISQADVAAHNIIAEIKRSEFENYKLKIENYIPWDYPYVILAGGKWAVAKIGPFIISGFFGWILKGLVELNYLRSIMPIWRAIKTWLKAL